jgi:DNA integrity scanning protein DisA with diadenylate cyclase activity
MYRAGAKVVGSDVAGMAKILDGGFWNDSSFDPET